VAYYERVFAQANRIRPDATARAGKKTLFLAGRRRSC